jgi:molybdopterin molybdotransferase
VEQLPLASALNRFAVEDVLAGVPNPPFHNSSMDGYALRAADSQGTAPLPVTGEQPAGLDRHLVLTPGSAIRIFTGAPLPSGADAVIMQEDVDVLQDGELKSIRCREPVDPGENIRRTGADLCRGQRILSKGDRFTAGRIGLLASQGMDSVEAPEMPRVAVLSTGDELAAPGTALRSGQIYNSNGPMLCALLAGAGVTNVTLAHCGDDYADTEKALARLMESHDFLLIAGGVSVGEHDQIKPALQHLGIDPELWRVKVRPGKPFLFCHRQQPRPLYIFGLPGNPVSSFVTFQVFVRPALMKWLGASVDETGPQTSLAEVTAEISNPGDRPHYIRGRVTGGKFTPLGMQQSHAIFGLSQANALLRLEAEESLSAGTIRQVLVI